MKLSFPETVGGGESDMEAEAKKPKKLPDRDYRVLFNTGQTLSPILSDGYYLTVVPQNNDVADKYAIKVIIQYI